MENSSSEWSDLREAGQAFLAFSAEELELMPTEQRQVLDVLLKRRLRQGGTEPDVVDCLRIRLQLESFFENRFEEPNAMRLALQLR